MHISQIFTFFVQFQCPLLCCSFDLYNCLLFVLPSILFVNVCFFGGFFVVVFFTPQVKDQQSHSMYLLFAYVTFVTTIFRLIVFKFYDFVIFF